MSKKKFKRYVYFLILLFAFFLISLGLRDIYDAEKQPWVWFTEMLFNQGFLLSIGVELLGAVIIFLLVDIYFQLGVDKELDDLKSQVETKFSPLVLAKSSHRFSLEEHYLNAQSVNIFGYNCATLLKNSRNLLVNSIRSGARVKILIVDINSEAGKVMCNHADEPEIIRNNFNEALVYVGHIEQQLEEGGNFTGSLDFMLTSWIPSCSMIITKYDQNNGILGVDVHSPSFRKRKNQSTLLQFRRSEYLDTFEYFAGQFEALWEWDSHPLPSESSNSKANSI